MSNFPKVSVEKSLHVGPLDPSHKVPFSPPDQPGLATINGPLIIGGLDDGYVFDNYQKSMLSILPAKDDPLKESGEFFGPLADALIISKQGNPSAGSGNRYNGVGIRVNANSHKIEAGELILLEADKDINLKASLTTVDAEAQFTKNVRVKKTVKAEGNVYSNNGAHVLSAKKNFDIPHPTKSGWRLTHSCIEGPEAAVYVRGKLLNTNIIILPDYWKNLVDYETLTVSITPIKFHQEIFVKDVNNSQIILESKGTTSIHCYYHIFAERIDTEKLIVEYEGDIEDYPGDNSARSIVGYHYDKKLT